MKRRKKTVKTKTKKTVKKAVKKPAKKTAKKTSKPKRKTTSKKKAAPKKKKRTISSSHLMHAVLFMAAAFSVYTFVFIFTSSMIWMFS